MGLSSRLSADAESGLEHVCRARSRKASSRLSKEPEIYARGFRAFPRDEARGVRDVRGVRFPSRARAAMRVSDVPLLGLGVASASSSRRREAERFRRACRGGRGVLAARDAAAAASAGGASSSSSPPSVTSGSSGTPRSRVPPASRSSVASSALATSANCARARCSSSCATTGDAATSCAAVQAALPTSSRRRRCFRSAG